MDAVSELVNIHIIKLRKPLPKEDEPESRNWTWKGDWSQNCDLWDLVRDQIETEEFADDGVFWMSTDDFFQNFETWGFLQLFQENIHYQVATTELKWETENIDFGFQAGGIRYPYSEQNPTLKIVSDASQIAIVIERPSFVNEIRMVDLSNQNFTVIKSVVQTMVLDHNPQGEYLIQGQLWAPILTGSCTVRIIALGSELPLRVSLVPSPGIHFEPSFLVEPPCSTTCSKSLSDTIVYNGGIEVQKDCDQCNRCRSKPPDALIYASLTSVWELVCSTCWKIQYGYNCAKCADENARKLLQLEQIDEEYKEPVEELILDPEEIRIGLDGVCNRCSILNSI